MTDEDLKRMRWASRRGMLELDLVLEPFVNTCYAGLDEVDRQRYRQLMECEDQDTSLPVAMSTVPRGPRVGRGITASLAGWHSNPRWISRRLSRSLARHYSCCSPLL